MLKPIEKSSLYSHIVNQLLEHIKNEVWRPGDQFPGEKELAQQFEVSRNSVREALKSLQHMGVIKSFAGKGTFVTDEAVRIIQNAELVELLSNNQGSTIDLLEVRMAIEVQAADLAAKNATEGETILLKSKLELLEEKMMNGKDFSVEGFAFHLQIAKMAKNKYILKFIQIISEELKAQRNPKYQRTINIERSFNDHLMVYKAIENRNSVDARTAMYAHFVHAIEDIRNREN